MVGMTGASRRLGEMEKSENREQAVKILNQIQIDVQAPDTANAYRELVSDIGRFHADLGSPCNPIRRMIRSAGSGIILPRLSEF